MKGSGLQTNDLFIRKYRNLSSQIIKNVLPSHEETLKSAIQLTIYYLVKELLLQKFFELVPFFPPEPSKESVRSIFSSRISSQKQGRGRSKESGHSILEQISEQIENELINKFEYILDENSEQEKTDKISPAIFEVLFEHSLKTIEKQKKGIFYTSKLEVNFMCREVIIQYLQENSELPLNKIISFVWPKKEQGFCDSSEERLSIFSREEILTIKRLLESVQVLDPACGAGAFILGMSGLLFELLQLINNHLESPQTAFDLKRAIVSNNLFGFDLDPQALQIAQLRLLLFQLGGIERQQKKSLLKPWLDFNLHRKDALVSIKEKKESKAKIDDSKLFGIVIGNPPYVRQELFGAKIKSQKRKEVTANSDYKTEIIQSLESFYGKEMKIPKDRKSDFYIYFFYRGLSLLKKGGILCFISSNSWLDVNFGFSFQEFLLKNFELKFIHTNLTRKSFDAAINTVIAIIGRPKDSKSINKSFVRFVAFRKPFSEIPFRESLIEIHSNYNKISNENFRCLPIIQQKLLESGSKNAQYTGEKWGAKYFRAPDIYFKIIARAKEKLIELGKIGKVRYPIKTGINDFFYLKRKAIDEFKIEKEFLTPVVKSPKKIKRIIIKQADLEKSLFSCNLTKEQLTRENKTGALSYIEWGEKQKTTSRQQTKKGIPWPEVPSVQSHKPGWYSINELTPADILCNRFFDRRFFFCFSDDPVVEDQTFYGVLLNEKYKEDKELLIALLNSTLSYFFLEIFGRTSLGKGALQFANYEMANHLIFNTKKLPRNLREKVLEKFKPILNREIKSIFEECKMSDRRAFDEIIFEWIGFSPKEVEELYQTLIALVRNRLEKSGQVI